MNELEKQQLVDDYLRRLSKGLEDIPASARRDLIEDVRGHIEEAWAASPEQSRSALLNILERLGKPEDLAKEERERLGSERYSQPSGLGLLEVVAIVLTVFVWPVGILLAWLSPGWYTRDNAVATAIPLIGLVLLIAVMLPVQSSVSANPNTTQPTVTSLERQQASDRLDSQPRRADRRAIIESLGPQKDQGAPTTGRPSFQLSEAQSFLALFGRLIALYGVLGAPLTAAAFLALRMRPHPRAVAMLAPALAAILLVCFLLSAWFTPVATGGGPAMQETEPIVVPRSTAPVGGQ